MRYIWQARQRLWAVRCVPDWKHLGVALVGIIFLVGCGGVLEQAMRRLPENDRLMRESVIWSADHSTGDMSQWYQDDCGGEFNSGGGQSSVTDEIIRSGNYAARMLIGDIEHEQGVRLFRWCEPQQDDELFYSLWFYFPQRYRAEAGWWNVFQFKSRTNGRNDAFFLLDVLNREDGNMFFRLFDWQTRERYVQEIIDIPIGRWFNLEVYYKSRPDDSGRITVWQDGVEIYDVTDVQTRYPDGDTQWSVSNYTEAISPQPAVIYIDDAIISRVQLGVSREEILEATNNALNARDERIGELEQFETRYQEVREERDEAQTALRRVELDREVLQAELEASLARTSELERFEDLYQRTSARLQDSERRSVEAEEARAESEARAASLAQNLGAAQRERDALQRELVQSQQILDAAGVALRSRDEQIRGLQHYQTLFEQAVDALRDNRSEMEALRAEWAALEAYVAALEGELAETTERLESLRDGVRALIGDH